MNTSLAWIKSICTGFKKVSAQEYADAMTLSGTKGRKLCLPG